MPWPVHPTGFFGARGDSDTYRIERSLRFNSADSAYLNRTPASNGNRKTFTISCWIKLLKFSSGYAYPITAGPDSSNVTVFSFSESGGTPGLNELSFWDVQGASYTARLVSNQVFRDPSAWIHVVAAVDTTQATASNRIRLYVNGSEVTSFSVATYPSQNLDLILNNSSYVHIIGAYSNSRYRYSDCYQTETYFIDGQALTPSSFGETDAITGRWKAKAYSGTYGTNGFYLSFKDNTSTTTLGYDDAGSNDWTLNNFSVTAGEGNDSLVDSPTNYGSDTGLGGEVRGNYCTINPLKTNSSITTSDGNLKTVKSAASNNLVEFGSIGVNSGKWYWEVKPTSIGGFYYIGIGKDSAPNNTYPTANDIFTYGNDGTKYNGSGSPAYGSTYSANDVIGVALDCDNGTIVFYKNNASQGTAFSSGISGSTWFAYAFVDGANNSHTTEWNFGQRPFAYTAPSGFKALCTQNLPQPTIQKPSKYMDALAYTGTGASNSISSLGFSPDLVWIKNRGTTTSHAIYDTTRGAQSQLSSDTTGDQVTSSTGLTSFDANGFTIGTSTLVNTSGTQYVAWAWDEEPKAGLDIVSYTGNGANRTIAHNLGVAPKMIIVKARVTASTDQGWPVYHASNTAAPETDYLLLNSTAASADLDTVWNDTAPTASVFSVGTNALVNTNNDTYIAYLFSEVEGYSKFGSYAGNASADGPFVWCGFKPKYIMVKKTSATGPWMVFDSSRDSFNVATSELRPNETTAEPIATRGSVDLLSNGFKIRSTSATFLGELGDFIFAAFAESPFKYARAR
jgi:hypothetical protein